MYKNSSLKQKIVHCGIPTSGMTTCYILPLQGQARVSESLVVRVRVCRIKSAAGPTRTRCLTGVELMERVHLRTVEAVLFLKLSYVLGLTLSCRFLQLSLVLFLLPIAWGIMWARSRRRIVRDPMIRLVVVVIGWLFIGRTECGGRDVSSSMLRSMVIAIASSPFVRHIR